MFIVVDGPSGSGKGTLIRELSSYLSERGILVHTFSEEEADPRRHEILDARDKGKKRGGTGDKEMTTVLVRHRKEMYGSNVEEAISDGYVVIADRGESATLAYQTVKGELSMEQVWKMHREARIRIPDLVVITSCDAEVSLSREESDKAQVGSIRLEMESRRGLSGKVSSEPGADYAEKLRKREAIHQQYDTTIGFLGEKGVAVLRIDTESVIPEQEVNQVLRYLGS